MSGLLQIFGKWAGSTYERSAKTSLYQLYFILLGLPLHIVVFCIYLVQQKRKIKSQQEVYNRKTDNVADSLTSLQKKYREQELNKQKFFGEQLSTEATNKIVQERVDTYLKQQALKEAEDSGKQTNSFVGTMHKYLENPLGIMSAIVLALPMLLLLLICTVPYGRFLFDRFIMMLFVIFGVTAVVFSILHFSSFDPARNILGEQASPEQIANFNAVHGLDQSYLVQLWDTFKGLLTFDLGQSYTGNENVTDTIMRKFPVTLELTLYSLLLAILIAIPAGIVAAVKRNTFSDQFLMFIALIGLSIPNFWMGLVLILQFSIHLGWLPATYDAEKLSSLLMPAIVLGTGLTAALARMTRSSTLDVLQEDYILMASAKGLSKRDVIIRHAVPNALIPIVTILGLQFGGMLGGVAVTEKVFNISGLGSYIVDQQFIPDIPGVLGGVIYIAIIISIVNMAVDILYTFLDPRIRSRMREY